MGTVRIKDHWAEQRLFERRAMAAAVIVVTLTLVLIGRLVMLQVVRYEYYAELSQGNRVRVEPLPAQRGLILAAYPRHAHVVRDGNGIQIYLAAGGSIDGAGRRVRGSRC